MLEVQLILIFEVCLHYCKNNSRDKIKSGNYSFYIYLQYFNWIKNIPQVKKICCILLIPTLGYFRNNRLKHYVGITSIVSQCLAACTAGHTFIFSSLPRTPGKCLDCRTRCPVRVLSKGDDLSSRVPLGLFCNANKQFRSTLLEPRLKSRARNKWSIVMADNAGSSKGTIAYTHDIHGSFIRPKSSE